MDMAKFTVLAPNKLVRQHITRINLEEFKKYKEFSIRMEFCNTNSDGKRDFIWEGFSIVNVQQDEKKFDPIVIPDQNPKMIIDSELFLISHFKLDR